MFTAGHGCLVLELVRHHLTTEFLGLIPASNYYFSMRTCSDGVMPVADVVTYDSLLHFSHLKKSFINQNETSFIWDRCGHQM